MIKDLPVVITLARIILTDMKPIYLIILLTVIGSGLYFSRSVIPLLNQKENCRPSVCSVPTFLKQFKLTEAYENTPDRFRGLYTNGDSKVRIDVQIKITQLRAEEITRERVMALNALFEDRLSAYPGQVSRKITCGEKYKPVIEKITQDNTEITLAKGLFTDRFTMGACVDDLLPYKGFIAWYWCSKTNTLYQIETISPKENGETEAVLSSLGCVN